MAADLVMAGASGGAVFEICAAKDGVFAITVADFEDGFLDMVFAAQVGEFLRFLLFERSVIGEKVSL